MDEKPTVLYRGAKENLDVVSPAKILDTERSRFPQNVTEAVFATPYKEDALSYAISARKGLGGTTLTPYYKDEKTKEIGWKLRLGFRKSELKSDEKTYLYELDPKDFVQNTEGEWYARTMQTPKVKAELTIEEALKHFDEVTFQDEGLKEGQNRGELR